jgi:phosphoribosylformylglycinamidine cyclo-ligase
MYTSGANTDRSRSGASRAFALAKTTWKTRENSDGEPVFDVDGAFANVIRFGNRLIGMTSDGVGTKIEVAERTGVYRTLGWDLLAMAVDDLAAVGLEPACLSNILDVDRIDSDIVEELMIGLTEAASFARVAVTGGEIAELGARISGYGPKMHFNWCATAIGVAIERDGPVIVSGRTVNTGDAVVALRETGFRSNGFSLARSILEKKYGFLWHEAGFLPDVTWGSALIEPSKVYCRAVVDLVRAGCPLNGIAHVTGGGIPGNFGRILKLTGLSAELESLFPPCGAMDRLREMGNLSAKETYENWNMGNGMLIVLPKDAVRHAIEIVAAGGFEAREAGRITAGRGGIRTVTIAPPTGPEGKLGSPLIFENPDK